MIEDIKQIALLGLWKTVINFDNRNKLSTYAYSVITNEINFFLRKEKKYKNLISIYEPVYQDYEGNNLTILDILEDDIDLLDELEFNEIINIEKEVLDNQKNAKHKQIYLLHKNGKTQTEIANQYNISQVQVYRIVKKIRNQIILKYKGEII